MDRAPGRGHRAGYVIAVAINAVMLWITHRLLDWGWPRFLTQDFEELLPVITLSFLASMVVNAAFIVADPPWFKSLCNVVTSAISLAVAVRTWQVFPFDFSSYAVDWSTIARVVVIVAAVGSAIATLVNLVNVPRELARRGRPAEVNPVSPTGSR